MAKKEDETRQRPDAITAPHRYEVAVLAAYFRAMGASQAKAAKAVGVDRSTIERWERSEFWSDACDDAHHRWIRAMDQKARAAIAVNMEANDATTARWYAERRIPELAPPKQTNKTDVSISYDVDVTKLTDEQFERYSQIVEEASQSDPDPSGA